MIPVSRSLWPDRDELGQCESNRETRYAAAWEEAHPDKRCAHTASFQIDGKRFCKRHAGLAALRILTERKQWTAINLKNGLEYTVTGEALNATNAQDGEMMVIYQRDGRVFVREAGEFADKFRAKGGV